MEVSPRNDVVEALAGVWLEPIGIDCPSGDDARSDPRYTEIVAALRSLDGGALTPAPYPMSSRVATAGKDLLRTRTKDLRLGAYVAYAELGLPSTDGLARGLALLAGLMERYWDSLHPPLRDADERVSALAWFVDRACATLRATGAPRSAEVTRGRAYGSRRRRRTGRAR